MPDQSSKQSASTHKLPNLYEAKLMFENSSSPSKVTDAPKLKKQMFTKLSQPLLRETRQEDNSLVVQGVQGKMNLKVPGQKVTYANK